MMRGLKRKKPPMIQGVHGVDLGGGRVHLWGPRFCDIGVHRNLRRMFKEQAPIQVDSSEDEGVELVSTLPSPRDADIAREAEAALDPWRRSWKKRCPETVKMPPTSSIWGKL